MSRPKNTEILAKARAVFKEQGITPQQRAREKIALSTSWIYRNGYTSADVLARLVGAKTRPGIAAKLVKWGLAKSTYIEGGGVIRGVPAYLYTLTLSGIEEALNHVDIPLRYDTEPYRAINRATVLHNMVAQNLTVSALSTGKIDNYFSERELLKLNADEVKEEESTYSAKIPDALWITGQNRTAIEVELSPKWGRELDQFIEGLLVGMDQGRWDDAIVYMKTKQTASRYAEVCSEGASVPHWVLSPSKRYITQGNQRILTRKESGKITFRTLPAIA